MWLEASIWGPGRLPRHPTAELVEAPAGALEGPTDGQLARPQLEPVLFDLLAEQMEPALPMN
jgi:hypothetical protein